MPDKEKIKKGLYQHCEGTMFDRCGECPYYEIGDEPFHCRDAILMDTLALLKEQESEWLEDSDPGQEYGTTWACRKCMHSIHKPFVWNPYDSKMEYCPFCGRRMVVKLDAAD